MKKLLFTILILSLTISQVDAVTDTPVDALLGNNDVDVEEVNQLEEDRVEEIENELTLSIPEYTDNPSHIITFVDPSEESEGVEIDIDESGFKNISSPYTLPSLSIGEHNLKFRFIDSLGAPKVLEYELVVLPRPPMVKAPTFDNNILTVSGTGLANSEALVTVSVNASNYTNIVDIDRDGDWVTNIELDSVPNGIFTVFAYTRKDGYASNPSEPAVLAYGDDGATTVSNYKGSENDISFNFSDISIDSIPDIVITNPDLIILSVAMLVMGFLLSFILTVLIRKNNDEKVNKDFSHKINNKGSNEKTLKELFGQDSSNEKQKAKKEPKIQKKEKIIDRKDFLKDFKNFDPDNSKGEVNKKPTKRDKKDVIISLTSQTKE